MAQSRSDLKGFFAAGSIPLSTHFHHLIDAPLNQADDGVKKTSATALEIQAAPASGEAILLYKNFLDNGIPAGATWRLTLRETDLANPATSLNVLSVQDKNAVSLLSIKEDGKVGIGKENPAEALDITGNIQLTGNILLPGATLRVNPSPADSLFQWLSGEIADNNSTPTGSVLMELKADGSLLLGATRRNVLQEIDALNARIDGLHPPPPLRIGDTHDGGIIFQLDTQAGTGTVVQAADNPIDIPTTADNPPVIMDPPVIDRATILATFGSEGWGFPTIAQLTEMHTNLHSAISPIGNFSTSVLYVSSEEDTDTGSTSVFDFTTGTSKPLDAAADAGATLLIRLVRAF